MFYSLTGTIDDIFSDKIVIGVNGIGFEVGCSSKTIDQLRLHETATLYTHLFLSEGIIALYGFYTIEERDMFRLLNGVSRIGPKLSISILSKMTPKDISAAVVMESIEAFDTVSGLGKKSAQRIILELREKINDRKLDVFSTSMSTEDKTSNPLSDAVSALVSLGYDGLSASRAVNSVKHYDSLEDLVVKALKMFNTK